MFLIEENDSIPLSKLSVEIFCVSCIMKLYNREVLCSCYSIVGVIYMATKSIYKDVSIHDKALGRGLLSALESAQSKNSKVVIAKKKTREIKGDKIKELFGAD